jgi:flagellar biosynthesis/type III secretory pathway M-ring protein FliF/YscJ
MHQIIENILFEEWPWSARIIVGALVSYGLYKHFMYLLDQNTRGRAAMQRQAERKDRKIREEQAHRLEEEEQRRKDENTQLAELEELRKKVSAMEKVKAQ